MSTKLCTPLLFILLFLIQDSVLACRCERTYDSLCEYVSPDESERVVVIGKVIANSPYTMRVRLEKRLSGAPIQTEIWITGGNGGDCIVVNALFETNKSYVMSLGKHGSRYIMSECEISYLPIENGVVKGPLYPGATDVPVADLYRWGFCLPAFPPKVGALAFETKSDHLFIRIPDGHTVRGYNIVSLSGVPERYEKINQRSFLRIPLERLKRPAFHVVLIRGTFGVRSQKFFLN